MTNVMPRSKRSPADVLPDEQVTLSIRMIGRLYKRLSYASSLEHRSLTGEVIHFIERGLDQLNAELAERKGEIPEQDEKS